VVVWSDIENEPQVQYLLPLAEACRRRGAVVRVTARDYGSTFELLRARDVAFEAVGAAYGASKSSKVRGLAMRTRALRSLMQGGERPDVLISASRAAALAARSLGIPSFVISDYEHANLTVFRWTRSTILHPDVIESSAYIRAGFKQQRLLPFAGLKEDLTFSGIALEAASAAVLDGSPRDSRVRVLVRPPAEESHYYREASRALYLRALRHVASQPQAVIVLAPRYARQRDDLSELEPENVPIVIEHPVPFLSLLRAVDLVLCSGGTMLREAAYLGIPAYSLFASEIGAVDRHLAAIGRAVLLAGPEDLTRIRIEPTREFDPIRRNPGLVDELAELIMANAGVADDGGRA
jgi:predicted glycosyltransferase